MRSGITSYPNISNASSIAEQAKIISLARNARLNSSNNSNNNTNQENENQEALNSETMPTCNSSVALSVKRKDLPPDHSDKSGMSAL